MRVARLTHAIATTGSEARVREAMFHAVREYTESVVYGDCVVT